MSRLTTLIRDAKHIKPRGNQSVVVWDGDAQCWRVAKYVFGSFELYGYGRRGQVLKGRWWMPLPALPEGDV